VYSKVVKDKQHLSVVSNQQTFRTMTQKRYYTVKVKRVRCVKQRKKLSLFEIVQQLLEYTSSNPLSSTYDEEKILLSFLQFIVKKLKKKHALKKSQLQADKYEYSTEVFTVDKATNTAVNTHIRFESNSSDSSSSRSRSRSSSRSGEDEHEEQVSSVNENELMEIRKTYEKRIELLNDKIRRQCNEIKEISSQQQHKELTTDERSTVFVTSTIFMTVVTSSWLYFVIYNTDIVSEEQGNIIFSNILVVQIMFIVLLLLNR
jgi:hypothetical protein